jgi:hypothetical protein
MATRKIHAGLIENLGLGIYQTFVTNETNQLKQYLGYMESPPLEQLLIDHILTLRLHLHRAEMKYNDAVVANRSAADTVTIYQDKHLTSTQSRYLRAIETLARVRRLARNTPSLQINIAREGGQQVNVQGEVSGPQVPQTSI